MLSTFTCNEVKFCAIIGTFTALHFIYFLTSSLLIIFPFGFRTQKDKIIVNYTASQVQINNNDLLQRGLSAYSTDALFNGMAEYHQWQYSNADDTTDDDAFFCHSQTDRSTRNVANQFLHSSSKDVVSTATWPNLKDLFFRLSLLCLPVLLLNDHSAALA